MKLFLILAAFLAVCNSERIYNAPVINPTNSGSVKPGLSYSGAAGGSNVPLQRPTAPVNPGTQPIRTNSGPVVQPKQGTGEFLPQNLTFILSARNLKSNSVDPIIRVSNSSKGSVYEKLGKTEELSNNANPDFYHVFWIIWKRGTQQKVKLEVRDVDNLRPDDPLGEYTFDLDEYVAKGEKLNVTLLNGTGSVSVQKTTPVKFMLYARTLPSLDTIGKSDPFAEVYWSVGAAGKKIKFGTTAVIDNEENPDWKETIEFSNYIKGTNQYLTLKVLDKDPTGADLIGEASIDVDSFVSGRQTKILRIGKAKTATVAITPAY